MNYCILNGKKSSLVKGLLIQSLPPISKPLMRTKTDEIDGRDGDIVTKLGYSAYDKEMSIGLFGDFDIDEVIRYFDSEGTVIFSNEPDKFYKYTIVSQIDFERLLRFKTATVTFHVQPFKYSAMDDVLRFSNNVLWMKPLSASKSGVAVAVQKGLITVHGTATSPTEFYLPVNEMELSAGSYSLNVSAHGSGQTSCSIRLIGNVPSDADSFGGTYLPLEEGTVSLNETLTESKTFKYVWLQIPTGSVVDFSFTVELIDLGMSSFEVFNRGNVISRPTMTIYGEGTVKLSINGDELFTLSIADHITLDGAQMNAYKDGALANRSVAGDYNNLCLKGGMNEISWVGYVTGVDIENVSRWI